MKQKISLLLLALSVILQGSLAFAANNDRLLQINQQIQHVQTRLSNDHKHRDVLKTQLASTETASGQLAKQLVALREELNRQKRGLNALIAQQKAYERQRDQLKLLLIRQIRAAYILGQQPFIKLLLNQDNPGRITQLLTYYQYINQDRAKDIEALNKTLERLRENKEKIAEQYALLQHLNITLTEKRKSLSSTREQRFQLVSQLSQRIQSHEERLSDLRANKEALEHTLIYLHAEGGQHAPMQSSTQFSRLKGHLTWPTRGRLSANFGTQTEQSTLKWNGVLLKAPEDQPVYAVATGRVVFSKWLPGYGLLLIIEHGEGYMTLYGRNHALYKQRGDAVHVGEKIASVGKSGGYKQSGLYFAIRHNAKVMNPTLWCH